MDAHDFAAKLEAAGYTEIETKALEPRPANHGHAHDSSVRGLVLDGEFIVACEGEPRSNAPAIFSRFLRACRTQRRWALMGRVSLSVEDMHSR